MVNTVWTSIRQSIREDPERWRGIAQLLTFLIGALLILLGWSGMTREEMKKFLMFF